MCGAPIDLPGKTRLKHLTKSLMSHGVLAAAKAQIQIF